MSTATQTQGSDKRGGRDGRDRKDRRERAKPIVNTSPPLLKSRGNFVGGWMCHLCKVVHFYHSRGAGAGHPPRWQSGGHAQLSEPQCRGPHCGDVDGRGPHRRCGQCVYVSGSGESLDHCNGEEYFPNAISSSDSSMSSPSNGEGGNGSPPPPDQGQSGGDGSGSGPATQQPDKGSSSGHGNNDQNKNTSRSGPADSSGYQGETRTDGSSRSGQSRGHYTNTDTPRNVASTENSTSSRTGQSRKPFESYDVSRGLRSNGIHTASRFSDERHSRSSNSAPTSPRKESKYGLPDRTLRSGRQGIAAADNERKLAEQKSKDRQVHGEMIRKEREAEATREGQRRLEETRQVSRRDAEARRAEVNRRFDESKHQSKKESKSTTSSFPSMFSGLEVGGSSRSRATGRYRKMK